MTTPIKPLTGEITITKRLREHIVWQRPDYGYCWIDLILLANDEDRRASINGVWFDVKRGQLIRSKRTLAATWQRSDKWVEAFLQFCQDEGMITVDSNHRRTIITVLNYEVYNPLKPQSGGTDSGTDSVSESGTDSGTDSVSESGTDSGTDSRRKGEMGKGKGKGEAPPPSFPEVPDDETVQQWCADYRDPARGVTKGIGEIWWRGWLAAKAGSNRPFPSGWKEALTKAFTADLVARHPKALRALDGNQSECLDSAPSALSTGGTPDEKKTAPTLGGRSVKQARYELSVELEGVQERLDAAHEANLEPNAADVKREKELQAQLKKIGA